MARRVKLFTVDHHKPPVNADGDIVKTFPIGKEDHLLGDNTFADMLAQYAIRNSVHADYDEINNTDIIGFQGYRKHLDFRLRREIKGDWVSLDPIEFRQYQLWQQAFAEKNIDYLLQDCDILTNPPYDVTDKGGMKQDWYASASKSDWDIMEEILRERGFKEFDLPTITSYCVFTGTTHMFQWWMDFWWPVAINLSHRLRSTCPDPGPRPDIYLPRRMAFLSERIYSLWLHHTGLRTKALPLLVCWELQ